MPNSRVLLFLSASTNVSSGNVISISNTENETMRYHSTVSLNVNKLTTNGSLVTCTEKLDTILPLTSISFNWIGLFWQFGYHACWRKWMRSSSWSGDGCGGGTGWMGDDCVTSSWKYRDRHIKYFLFSISSSTYVWNLNWRTMDSPRSSPNIHWKCHSQGDQVLWWNWLLRWW